MNLTEAKALSQNGLSGIEEKVNRNIHPKDEMFGGQNREHYFSVGLSALNAIEKALALAGKKPSEIKSVLDFPCGYGRVMRYLKAYLPQASFTGSEIDTRYFEFVEKEFNASTILSQKDFTQIKFPRKYDLIWCGSLFTHLSAQKYVELLQVFSGILEDKGVLVFSTHGRFSPVVMEKGVYGLHRRGKIKVSFGYKFLNFGYSDYLASPGYGISICKPSWVIKQIEKFPDLKLLMYSEKLWDNHQDIVGVVKENII